ncbi:MAG: pantoate--beta-alanine ligase [Rhodopirellula sp.]|nr:pantoate--beta-alanine ligase [Rhodopirellula sp.]
MQRPAVVSNLAELRQAVASARAAGKRVGLVPTMGALHEGHLSLVRASQSECSLTVVTIFVNPSQFGPGEDYDRYPRTLDADLDALGTCGGGILVFVPRTEEVYPPGFASWVEVGPVAEPWEGRCRPGHFRGVATIVLKLFNMVGADIAYFGQKDYQQALVIRRMVEDLNVPIEVRVCPTVREPDGLAMSSRNAYLSAEARQQALVLWKSLCLADAMVCEGHRGAAAIRQRLRELIQSNADMRIDYIALADPETLKPVEQVSGRTLAALAVRLGSTRLIDNRFLEPPPS